VVSAYDDENEVVMRMRMAMIFTGRMVMMLTMRIIVKKNKDSG